jgi:hypothetical protein
VQNGVLIDMYARSDITQLAKGNAYNRLQWEEVTVGQALALAQIAAAPWPNAMPSSSPSVCSMTASDATRIFIANSTVCLQGPYRRL